jgi:protein required for attachment to host cells
MDRQQRLEEIEDLLNPEGRMSDRELTTDAHPRFRGTAGPGSDREETAAVEHEVEKFARRVGDYLDKARLEQRYGSLVLVAPPKFLGVLRKELSKEVGKLVAEEMPKDLSWLSAREIERYLKR